MTTNNQLQLLLEIKKKTLTQTQSGLVFDAITQILTYMLGLLISNNIIDLYQLN